MSHGQVYSSHLPAGVLGFHVMKHAFNRRTLPTHVDAYRVNLTFFGRSSSVTIVVAEENVFGLLLKMKNLRVSWR